LYQLIEDNDVVVINPINGYQSSTIKEQIGCIIKIIHTIIPNVKHIAKNKFFIYPTNIYILFEYHIHPF